MTSIIYASLISLGSILFNEPIVKPESIPSYFVEVDEVKDSIVYTKSGEFLLSQDEELSREYWDLNNSSLVDTLKHQLSLLPKEKRNIIIYIHGLWGNTWQPFSECNRALQKNIWSQEDSPYGLQVSLMWNGKLNYDDNVSRALRSGALMRDLVQEIHQLAEEEDGHVSYLIHSMGHRVFQGLWSDQFDKGEYSAKHIIMAGADLHTDTFEEGKPMDNIEHFAESVTVQVHNNDRTLGVSQAINKRGRLGRSGIKDLDLVPDIVRQVDVSVIDDLEFFGAKFSNHRYYYASPTVREDMINILWHKDIVGVQPARTKLDHEKRFKLEPGIKSE